MDIIDEKLMEAIQEKLKNLGLEEKLRSLGLKDDNVANVLKRSANQVWLAGLGAFAKALGESGNLFESLVKKGEEIESRTKEIAEGKIEIAKDKTSDTWDKLEQVFVDRVSRALIRLGVPTNNDIQSLSARIDELNQSIKELIKSEAKL